MLLFVHRNIVNISELLLVKICKSVFYKRVPMNPLRKKQ